MMTKKTLFLVVLLFSVNLVFSQVPQQFNYQAVARNQDGTLVKNQTLTVRVGILQGGTAGTLVWQEDHTVTTNDFGLFSLVIGDPAATPSGGSLATFSDIDWSLPGYFLKMEVDLQDGNGYHAFDPVPFLSVPYAQMAGEVTGRWGRSGDTLVFTEGSVTIGTAQANGSKLAVQGDDVSSDKPLFEVKRKDGQTVFAVYNDSIRMYVNATETVKGRKGGFAIGGFDATKGTGPDYLRVTPDSVRIYIDPSEAKGPRGGFAIGGYDAGKGVTQEYLRVTDDSTRVYFDTLSGKGNRGGFAIGGYGAAKGNTKSYFDVSGMSAVEKIDGENRILWYPKKNAFMTGKVIVESNDSVGFNSMASGYETRAIGDYSEAFGFQSVSRGAYTMAIGKNSLAQGNNAYAFGNMARAMQDDAFALGSGAFATGLKSFAFGSVGIDSSGAVTGNTIASGESSFAIGLGSQATGTGAFAIGANDTASGNFSTALGYKTKAKGRYAMATGMLTDASGWYSFTSGYLTEASSYFATAMGRSTIASKYASFASGYLTEATEYYATAMGDHTVASGTSSFAVNSETVASGTYATAMGYGTKASGIYSVSSGNNSEASGSCAAAMGYLTRAQAYASFVIGQNNLAEGNTSVWTSSDPLFVAGNGTSNYSRNNALTLYKNGNLTIAGTLTENSDIRLKKNISPLSGVMTQITKIEPVRFEFKDPVTHPAGEQIGLIAQEVEATFPELVSQGADGMLSVNYTKLTAVLLKAIQEQQTQIENLNELVLELQTKLNRVIENQ